jgi:hypothetical protein
MTKPPGPPLDEVTAELPTAPDPAASPGARRVDETAGVELFVDDVAAVAASIARVSGEGGPATSRPNAPAPRPAAQVSNAFGRAPPSSASALDPELPSQSRPARRPPAAARANAAPTAAPVFAGPPRESRRPLAVISAVAGAATLALVVWIAWPHVTARARGSGGVEPGYAGVGAYLEQVGMAVAKHTTGLKTPPRFATARDSTVNAGVEADRVVIANGALRRLRSEAQLAALTAHLLAHMARGAPIANEKGEAAIDAEAQKALEAAGYSASAYREVLELFGPNTPFCTVHPVGRAQLAVVEARKPGGVTREATYEAQVLDRIGSTAKR